MNLVIREFLKRNLNLIICIICGLLAISFCVQTILFSYRHIETLEYANVDFEWNDDFQSYEIAFEHNDNRHFVTIKDKKAKFIYTDEDFLNFVAIDYEKRIVDGKDYYSVSAFYINLNYKEIEYE